DDHVVADRAALANRRAVADHAARADARAGEEGRPLRDDRPLADLERRQRLAREPGPGRQGRLLPEDRERADATAVAERRPLVDDRRLVDFGPHAGTAVSDSWSCSSARTTTSPSRAAKSDASPRTRPRKWRHSSFSGSSDGIFGLKMSPVLVCHSP